jgi:hypothetical protein
MNLEQSFKHLYDGKLSRKFFNVFLLELHRDYLIFRTSYENGDMNLLRKYTLPLIPKEYDDKGNVISPGLGTG